MKISKKKNLILASFLVILASKTYDLSKKIETELSESKFNDNNKKDTEDDFEIY